MNKDIIKEIFQLVINILVAVCEILWEKTKECFRRFWDVFFGMADVSSREQVTEQKVWGDTGEDTWPAAPEAPREIKQEQEQEPQQKTEIAEIKVYPPPPTSIPELPDGYGDNRIVLMVRDPLWLFAYWEIRKDILNKVLNTLGPLAHRAKTVIRVYDVTDIIFNGNNAHHRFDIDVTLEAQKWYIHAGLPDRVLCAELGILTANGTFRILARSNTVKTPRMGVSEVVDETWMCIESLYEKAYVPMDFSISEFIFKRAEERSPEEPGAALSSSDTFSSLAALKK